MGEGWVDGSPYGVVDSGCRVMLVAFEFDCVFHVSGGRVDKGDGHLDHS